MKLWIFPSENERNITIGYTNKLWAVSYVNEATMKARHTKATGLKSGDPGLLYCSEDKTFRMPFLIRSFPEFDMIEDIWPEPWSLPFKIMPLASPGKSLSLEDLKYKFGIVGNSTQFLNGISELTVFVPNPIDESIWTWILGKFETDMSKKPDPLAI